MVSWWHGLGEVKPPPAACNRRGCFGWAGSNHHVHQGKAAKSTTPPCHHVTMSPPSHSVLYTGASPCVQPPPVAPKGRGSFY